MPEMTAQKVSEPGLIPWPDPDNKIYPNPHFGTWVYDRTHVQDSRKSKNNHNVECGGNEHCSPDRKWRADLVRITLTLVNPDPDGEPTLRFRPPINDADVKKRLRIISGPTTHWEYVGYTYDGSGLKMVVSVKGFTRPQRWKFTWDVERYEG